MSKTHMYQMQPQNLVYFVGVRIYLIDVRVWAERRLYRMPVVPASIGSYEGVPFLPIADFTTVLASWFRLGLTCPVLQKL